MTDQRSDDEAAAFKAKWDRFCTAINPDHIFNEGAIAEHFWNEALDFADGQAGLAHRDEQMKELVSLLKNAELLMQAFSDYRSGGSRRDFNDIERQMLEWAALAKLRGGK